MIATKCISFLWLFELPKNFAVAKSWPAFLNLVGFLVAVQCLNILIFREIDYGKEWEKEEIQFKWAHAFCLSSKKETQTLEMQVKMKDPLLCLSNPENNWHLASCPISDRNSVDESG